MADLELAGFEVVGTSSDPEEVIEAVRRARPHVALIDVRSPGGGVAATEGVSAVDGCRVLALAAYQDRREILEMLLAGAVGYVLKGTPSDEVASIDLRTARTEVGSTVDVPMEVITDLSKRSPTAPRVRPRLRRSKERFRGFVEAAPDAVIMVNQEGEIVLVNEETELMFGYDRSDLIGKRIEFLVPERFQLAHIRHRMRYRSAPRTRRLGTVHGLVGRRMKGEEFPVDISLSTFESDESHLVVAFVRDLSVGERAGDEARLADQA